MQVCVDKARDDDEVRRIHDGGPGGLESLPQGRDTRAVDQDVAAKVTVRLVHGDDKCVLDQCVSHLYSLPVMQMTAPLQRTTGVRRHVLPFQTAGVYAIDCINVRLHPNPQTRCLPIYPYSC